MGRCLRDTSWRGHVCPELGTPGRALGSPPGSVFSSLNEGIDCQFSGKLLIIQARSTMIVPYFSVLSFPTTLTCPRTLSSPGYPHQPSFPSPPVSNHGDTGRGGNKAGSRGGYILHEAPGLQSPQEADPPALRSPSSLGDTRSLLC